MKGVIVTGAAGGIGRAIAQLLARQASWTLILCDCDEAGLRESASLLGDAPHSIYPLDVADAAQVAGLFDGLKGRELHGLVNNAGIYPAKKPLDYTPEDIQRVLSVNLAGAIHFSQKFFAHIEHQQGEAVIVNMASVTAFGGSSDIVYGASKAGLVGLTKSCALAFAPGIRVNAVAPALVDTPMLAQVPPERIRHYRETELIEKPLTAQAVAESVLYLLSPSARHCTGMVLDINNGCYLR